MGTCAQYNVGQRVLGHILFKVLAAFFLPFLLWIFKLVAPALFAFSMFFFATVPGNLLLL